MSRKDSAKQNDETLFHKFGELFNKHLYGELYSDFNFILQMSGEDKVEFDQTKLKELFLSAYNNRMELEGELVVPAILPGDRLKERPLSHEERHTILDHVGKSFNLAVKELRIVPQKIQKHPGGRPAEEAVKDRRKSIIDYLYECGARSKEQAVRMVRGTTSIRHNLYSRLSGKCSLPDSDKYKGKEWVDAKEDSFLDADLLEIIVKDIQRGWDTFAPKS